MEIRDILGDKLFDVPLLESSVYVEELMKRHDVTLVWNSIDNYELPLGAYIEFEGVRFSLLSPYTPNRIDEFTFEYKPVFHHPVMRWAYIPFFFYTYSGDSLVSKEIDWSLTDNPANFMKAVCDAIKNETGDEWTYAIADNLKASHSLSFSNIDIFSALNAIAAGFETEWWYDYDNKVVHLAKAEYGDKVNLEVGENVGIPSVNESKKGYATRFYVFGSTRNIEQNYAGSNVSSVVNKRLTLDPVKYPNGYIDVKENLSDEEVLAKVLVFDEVYPRSAMSITDVKVRLMWRLDNDNNKVQIGTDASGSPVYDQYAIWYFKIPGFEFSNDMVISGKALSVHFNDGPLSGREFELTYHDTSKKVDSADGADFYVDAGDYEINFIEEGTYVIPSVTGLVPVDGNSITLFNIVMPEEYRKWAYNELESEAVKEINKQFDDENNYSLSSNPVAFSEENTDLKVGQNVFFINGRYELSTRVIRIEKQLDRPFEQKITIGNEKIKGNTQELKEEIVNANQNINLLASINDMTNSLTQAYQRTQKAILESLSKYSDMFGVDADGNVYVKKLPNGKPRNFYSFGELTAGGVGGGSVPGQDGESYNRLDSWEDYDAEAGDVLSAVLGYDLKKQIEELRESGGGEAVIGDMTIIVGDKSYKSEDGVITLPAYATEDYINDKIGTSIQDFKNLGLELRTLASGAKVLVSVYDFASDGDITASGANEESIIPRPILKEWSEYDKSIEDIMANYALSAKLGYELYLRMNDEGRWHIL